MGVYRLSCGLSQKNIWNFLKKNLSLYQKEKVVDLGADFMALDKIMPHPIYAWMGWICVNSPSNDTFNRFLNLMDCSYEKAKQAYNKKIINQKI